MPGKMTITKLVLRPDGNVDLYGKGHKYVDLILFEPADLFDVGIDPKELVAGVEVPCKFYAHYNESDKTKSTGTPYLDVDHLEPLSLANGQTALAGIAGGEAVLEELRAIRHELRTMREMMVSALGLEPDPGLSAQAQLSTKPTDPPTITDETAPGPGPEPLSDRQANQMFSSMAGPAIREHKITSAQVNAITAEVVAIGWRDALHKLRKLIAQAEQETELEQAE